MGGGEQKYCLEILNNGFGMILVGGVRGFLGYAGFYRRGEDFSPVSNGIYTGFP